jgi:hypothetical protein
VGSSARHHRRLVARPGKRAAEAAAGPLAGAEQSLAHSQNSPVAHHRFGSRSDRIDSAPARTDRNLAYRRDPRGDCVGGRAGRDSRSLARRGRGVPRVRVPGRRQGIRVLQGDGKPVGRSAANDLCQQRGGRRVGHLMAAINRVSRSSAPVHRRCESPVLARR